MNRDWEVTATSGDTHVWRDEENVYTLFGVRAGSDRNGNPKYRVTCIVCTPTGGVRYVKELNRTVTSYNIRETLIHLAGRF